MPPGENRALAAHTPANATGPADVVVMPKAQLAEVLREAHALGERGATRAGKRQLDDLKDAHSETMAQARAEAIEAQKSAHAHGWHKAVWIAGLGGIVVGAVVVLTVLELTGEQNLRLAREGFVTGSATEAARNTVYGPPAPCIPGQRYTSDGRECPAVHGP